MKGFASNLAAMFVLNKRKEHHFNEHAAAPAQQFASTTEIMNAELKYKDVKNTWRTKCNGVSPLPGRFAEYDLVIPIGSRCTTVDLLRAHKLRRFSSPFDWTMIHDFDKNPRYREKIQCLCNNFVGYFDPADLYPLSMFVEENRLFQDVLNIKTMVRFPHLFDINKSLELQMPEIVEKISRRSKRLLDAIDRSERILILWTHRLDNMRCYLDVPVSDKDVLWTIEKLKKRWPGKQFDLVFFEHDGTKKEYEFDKKEVALGAYRICSNHFIVQNAYSFVADYGKRQKMYCGAVSEMIDNISLSDKLAGFMGDDGL